MLLSYAQYMQLIRVIGLPHELVICLTYDEGQRIMNLARDIYLNGGKHV